jgi:hypothetical protein
MSDNPLAALAMRERAAKACDGFCSECARAIRALPTTFTDAELLAAAMQLPDVRALVEALNHAQYGLSWAVRYFKDQDVTKDDPCPPCTRGLSATRAALAPFTKGGNK